LLQNYRFLRITTQFRGKGTTFFLHMQARTNIFCKNNKNEQLFLKIEIMPGKYPVDI